MKRCESSGTFRICVEAFFAHSRRRRRRSNLPIAAVAAAGWLPHISGARGGGRSPSRHQNNERGPTQRETLKHLFGITGIAASQEVSIRTPPLYGQGFYSPHLFYCSTSHLLYCRFAAIGATRHQLNFSWPESAFLTAKSGFRKQDPKKNTFQGVRLWTLTIEMGRRCWESSRPYSLAMCSRKPEKSDLLG